MKEELKRKPGQLDLCLVCGLKFEDYFPYGEDGESPTYDYCDCCGVEFGYGDFYPESRAELQKNWIDGGGKWNEPEAKPKDWDMNKQLENLK